MRDMINRFLCSILLLSSFAAAESKVTFPAGIDHVTVPFSDHRNHMVIQVSVNGMEPQPAILDTGAHGAVLNGDEATVKALGLKDVQEAEIRGAGGGGAGLKAVVAQGVTLGIGGATLTGNTLAVGKGIVPTGAVAQLVVGRSIFASFVVKVDWDNMELTLFDPATFKYTGKGSEVPIEFDRHGLPYIRANVTTADAKDVPVKLVVDSGASHPLSLMYGKDSPFKEPTGIEKRVIGRGASGEVRAYVANSPSISIAGYTLKNVPTFYPDESLGPIGHEFDQQGNLGAGILRRFTVIYDYPQRRMFIEPNQHFEDEFKPLPPMKGAPAGSSNANP